MFSNWISLILKDDFSRYSQTNEIMKNHVFKIMESIANYQLSSNSLLMVSSKIGLLDNSWQY